MEPDKCSDLSWFRSGAPPTNMVLYVRAAIEKSRCGAIYSEFEW